MKWSAVLHPLCFILLLLGCSTVHASQVSFNSNGYDDIVVGISSAAPKNQAEIILENIKAMIQQASPILHTATYEWAYFRSVHILIPDTWSHIQANLSTWESFQGADVIIDSPNPVHGDVPYTRQLGGCGDLGDYIHLTPEYVATLHQPDNSIKYGNPGKVFVHEWAHFRFGVFDEYGQPGNPSHPLFYRKSRSIIPNVCADKPPPHTLIDISTNETTCKIDPATNLYDVNCRFVFLPSFQPETSLMSYHQLESVVHFCRDDQKLSHVYDAPNMHNTMCRKQAVWSVIQSSPDFASFNEKKARRLSRNVPKTEFRIIRQARGARFVLVADVSGSMQNFNRIGNLNKSVRSWIKNDLPVGSKLGIVQFSSRAQVLSKLRAVEDEASRQSLIDRLPQQLYSATCLGCGLALANQMLSEDGQGGIALLVTDGKNSPGYDNIFDVLPELLQSKIRVITIALGSEADENLENLADLTDGKSYFVRDEDTSEKINEAFLQALTYQPAVTASTGLYVKLYDQIVMADEPRHVEGQFEVDLSVGSNLRLIVFGLGKKSSIGSMKLTGPDGQSADRVEYDGSAAFVKIDLAKAGQWTFTIELVESQKSPLQVTVKTQLLPNTSAPITTQCWVHNGADIKDPATNPIRIHAQLWKGSSPVIGANVRAYIEKPNDELDELDLLDDGNYADTTPNDGIYSRFYPNVSVEGRYSLKCQIWDNGSAYVGLGFIGSASSVYLNYKDGHHPGQDRVPVGIFSRISSGGSFKIEKPISVIDAYPPGHVRDLAITLVNEKAAGNVSVSLRWTAPGDELDFGIVSRYELKYSDDAANLLDDVFELHPYSVTDDLVSSGSLEPRLAGLVQEVSFTLPDAARERPYYVALRALDKANKVSPISNLVSFFLPEDIPLNQEPIVAHPPSESSAHHQESTVSVNYNKRYSRSSPVIHIILIILVITALAVTVVVLFLKRVRSRVRPFYNLLTTV